MHSACGLEDNNYSTSLENKMVGFIGAGNMAQAIGFSILNAGLVGANQVYVSATSFRNLDKWKLKGVSVTTNNADIIRNCDIVFLAIKPQYLDSVISSLCDNKEPMRTVLFVSILVGVTLATLKQKLNSLGNKQKYDVIRVMPNTPILVQAGCSLLCFDQSTPQIHVDVIKKLLSAGSVCEVVPESLLNPLSAVCGSGPAFVYMMIEALSDGAVKAGVPREMATRLVSLTMIGANEMVLKTGKHPGQLKDEVCSPGGSTIAGIYAMEEAAVRSALMKAVEASTNRAAEIAETFK